MEKRYKNECSEGYGIVILGVTASPCAMCWDAFEGRNKEDGKKVLTGE